MPKTCSSSPKVLDYAELLLKIRIMSNDEDQASKMRAAQVLDEVADMLDAAIKEHGLPATEEDRQHQYLLGQAVALEGVSGQLRRLSGELFCNGKDEPARWHRDLADKFQAQAVTTRAESEALRK